MRARQRQYKMNDLIRWYAEAGLTPRVTLKNDGDVVIDAMSANDVASRSVDQSSTAARIEALREKNGRR